MHHVLKTDPDLFNASWEGKKPWEIRRNDRNFQVGDTVTRQETRHTGDDMALGRPLEFTGREITGRIAYTLPATNPDGSQGPSYGLRDEWVVFTCVEISRKS